MLIDEFSQYLNRWLDKPDQKNKSFEEMAEELFSQSIKVFPDQQGKTLLHYTAHYFFDLLFELRFALLKLLFERKADANAIDQLGRTALHDIVEAWQKTHLESGKEFDLIAELFFKNAAKFTIQDKNEKTPLDVLIENPHHDVLVIKILIKFVLLKQPYLAAPSCVYSHERAMKYWRIHQRYIKKLLEQKISDSGYTLYDICSASNPTQLAKSLYPYHEQLKEFTSEAFKNKFYTYSSLLQSNLELLQPAIIKKINTNIVINKTNLLLRKNLIPINEDIVREIFNYLSYPDMQTIHKAVHPAFFKERTAKISNKQINIDAKPTLSCCCIS